MFVDWSVCLHGDCCVNAIVIEGFSSNGSYIQLNKAMFRTIVALMLVQNQGQNQILSRILVGWGYESHSAIVLVFLYECN